jgi:N-acetylneuraminic acid mutarotase
VLESEGYFGLGRNFDNFKRSIYSYNPGQDDWDDEESLGGVSGDGLNRSSSIAFVVNDRAYVGLGQGVDPFFRDIWQYNPVTKAWTQKADFGGTGRRQAVAFAIDTAGYVGTGIDVNGYKRDFWKYIPSTNSWTQVADFAGSARKQAVAFTMHGKGFVGTGDDGTFRKDFWMYDPASDSWTPKADFGGTARYAATAFSIQSQGFVMTGYDVNLEFKKDVWEYNYYANAWVQRADFPGSARSNASAFVIGHTAYFGTGYDGNDFLDDFYEYQRIVSNELPSFAQIEVYPNPATERVFISGQEAGDASVRLFDLNGRDVSGALGLPARVTVSAPLCVDLSGLAGGGYFLAFSFDDGRTQTRKLVVRK